jgi:hypothetical protein
MWKWEVLNANLQINQVNFSCTVRNEEVERQIINILFWGMNYLRSHLNSLLSIIQAAQREAIYSARDLQIPDFVDVLGNNNDLRWGKM